MEILNIFQTFVLMKADCTNYLMETLIIVKNLELILILFQSIAS